MQKDEKNIQFQELVEQHKGILFKVARTYCRNPDDRQDLVQEMMIQVWQSLHKYNDHYKISTWLYRIALNTAISYYRKNTKRQTETVPLTEYTPEPVEIDQSTKEHQLTLLELFISELNDLDKALIVLYLEDKKHAEIADILGISESNVGTKIGRIKTKLKARFSHTNT